MKSDSKMPDIGLLILRIGIGASFLFIHGLPKVLGGPEKWEGLGRAMETFGIAFTPVFWGFMAAITEALGGLLLAVGLGTRFVCVFLTVVMIVAAGMHLNAGDGLAGASHAIEVGLVFIAFIFTGAGRLSIDRLVHAKTE